MSAENPFEQNTSPESDAKGSDFFNEHYFSADNYGVPEGYKAYDTDGFWRSVTSAVDRYVKEPQDGTFLDLGCAFGHLLKRSPFGKNYGVDISSFALGEAKNSVKASGIYEKTLLANADANFSLPFAEDSFNCITALDVIEHTADRPGTIKEISRVISTGGLLIVGAPVTDTTEGKIWGKYLDGDESHVSKPTRDEFFTDLENAGFEIKEFAYYFPLPFAKIPFPRTNMEIVAVKTDKTAEELRTIHEGRFNSPGFLKSQESVTSVA